MDSYASAAGLAGSMIQETSSSVSRRRLYRSFNIVHRFASLMASLIIVIDVRVLDIPKAAGFSKFNPRRDHVDALSSLRFFIVPAPYRH